MKTAAQLRAERAQRESNPSIETKGLDWRAKLEVRRDAVLKRASDAADRRDESIRNAAELREKLAAARKEQNYRW